MTLSKAALLALLASLAPAAAAAAPVCDDVRAADAVKAAAAREKRDVSTLQLVVEGPYARGKFVRTHPTFRVAPAVDRRLAKRTFWFVWYHPPFGRAVASRGGDVWGLVDAWKCEVLHLARER